MYLVANYYLEIWIPNSMPCPRDGALEPPPEWVLAGLDDMPSPGGGGCEEYGDEYGDAHDAAGAQEYGLSVSPRRRAASPSPPADALAAAAAAEQSEPGEEPGEEHQGPALAPREIHSASFPPVFRQFSAGVTPAQVLGFP